MKIKQLSAFFTNTYTNYKYKITQKKLVIKLIFRDGKFIFVSSTTSTTVTTTTSFLRGTETCLILSSTTINQLCQGRRRRSLIRKDFDSGEDNVDIDASTVSG